MASVNASDIPEIQKFMNPLWTAIKKFYDVEITDEYSAEVIDYLDALCEQFTHPLCKELILGLHRYIENEQRTQLASNRRIKNEQSRTQTDAETGS